MEAILEFLSIFVGQLIFGNTGRSIRRILGFGVERDDNNTLPSEKMGIDGEEFKDRVVGIAFYAIILVVVVSILR